MHQSNMFISFSQNYFYFIFVCLCIYLFSRTVTLFYTNYMKMTIENVGDKNLQTLNLDQIGALQQKRTLAFVNHFVITTTQFLNNFMKNCELKLMQYERKLEKINASVVLLEDRLSSIPEISNANSKVETLNKTEENHDKNGSETHVIEESTVDETCDTKSEASAQVSPEYMRFVKMAQVGVPLEAVKLKASLEGLNPLLLEKFINK